MALISRLRSPARSLVLRAFLLCLPLLATEVPASAEVGASKPNSVLPSAKKPGLTRPMLPLRPDCPDAGITPYVIEGAGVSRPAMLVLPGGGYANLAKHEGETYALWLNALGYHAFVLRYRLGSGGHRHPEMLQDAARGLRWVRAHAAEYGVRVDRVGIMGSSAGGHLASTLLTHFASAGPEFGDEIDAQSARPDLGVLCYPVISMADIGHAGSRRNLLGNHPAPELIELLSNEKQVKKDTPPTFLWHTYEDATVPIENSLLFATALRAAGVPFELHTYEKGHHGLGLVADANGRPTHPWAAECARWLAERWKE